MNTMLNLLKIDAGKAGDCALGRQLLNSILSSEARTMPTIKPRFCLSRAENTHCEPMHGYRGWPKIRDLGLSDATHGACDAWMTHSNV